jgi:glycogen debranching enzyme
MAGLYDRAGEEERAKELRHEADELHESFNRDFWLENLGFYALALQNGGKPAAVISSNPGQALWTKIIEKELAKQTVDHLMSEDMFSGWGVRTLSEKERSYNPIGYHLGTVWPHDNAIIAAGFRKYGFDDEACQIFTGVVEAAMQFDYYRLPEVFSGFRRSEYNVPVHYPVACHPQAWSAGAVPFLVEIMLGLEPDAFNNRLLVTRPILPDFIDLLEVRSLQVGKASVDLRFERTSDNNIALKVLEVEGKLDIMLSQG